MADNIIRLKHGDTRSTDDGMIISRTPSGKWDVRGASDNGDAEGATFFQRNGIADFDRAIREAHDWGSPRGIKKIYVKGDPDAKGS